VCEHSRTCVHLCVSERKRICGDIYVIYNSVAVKDSKDVLLFVSVGRNISISRCHNFNTKKRRGNL
jgi:hypothetical protein